MWRTLVRILKTLTAKAEFEHKMRVLEINKQNNINFKNESILLNDAFLKCEKPELI